MAGTVFDTGVDTTGISRTYHHKVFKANGRYWFICSDGTDIKALTSTDGTSWSSTATVRSSTTSMSQFDAFHDGTYVHYVYQTGNTIYYRRGTTVSDGTISWSASEQYWTENTTINRPVIAVDSGGKAVIGWIDNTADLGQPWVIKNANTDGTWSTDGSAYQINTGGSDTNESDEWGIHLLVVNGKVLCTYARTYNALYARLNSSGTTWDSEEVAYSAYGIDYGYTGCYSVDTTNNEVYGLIINYTPYDYIVIKRSSGGSWSVVSTIDTTGDYLYYSMGLLVVPGGDLYCVVANKPTASQVNLKRRIGGSWDGSWTNLRSSSTVQNSGQMAIMHEGNQLLVFWREDYDSGGNNNDVIGYFEDLGGGEEINNIYINYGIFS